MNAQTLLTGWNLMRWVRLLMGIYMAVQAVQLHDQVAGFISAIFLFQAVTNTGCCGGGACAVPVTKKDINKTEDVQFEEIKTQ